MDVIPLVGVEGHLAVLQVLHPVPAIVHRDGHQVATGSADGQGDRLGTVQRPAGETVLLEPFHCGCLTGQQVQLHHLELAAVVRQPHNTPGNDQAQAAPDGSQQADDVSHPHTDSSSSGSGSAVRSQADGGTTWASARSPWPSSTS